jgi:hypothetical protein
MCLVGTQVLVLEAVLPFPVDPVPLNPVVTCLCHPLHLAHLVSAVTCLCQPVHPLVAHLVVCLSHPDHPHRVPVVMSPCQWATVLHPSEAVCPSQLDPHPVVSEGTCLCQLVPDPHLVVMSLLPVVLVHQWLVATSSSTAGRHPHPPVAMSPLPLLPLVHQDHPDQHLCPQVPHPLVIPGLCLCPPEMPPPHLPDPSASKWDPVLPVTVAVCPSQPGLPLVTQAQVEVCPLVPGLVTLVPVATSLCLLDRLSHPLEATSLSSADPVLMETPEPSTLVPLVHQVDPVVT